jgi:hypothetical protein
MIDELKIFRCLAVIDGGYAWYRSRLLAKREAF